MLLSHDATECRSVFVDVKPTRYSVPMTQDDAWSARTARLVAREVRRYREGQGQRPRISAQQLADRTEELGMPIPRSVLANLESGRRETVSVAEILVLAAALNVAPIELICPVGYDKEIELLPGRSLDPLGAMRWFTGELKLDLGEAAPVLRQPGTAEQSSTYLVEYHDELITRLRVQEAEAARAAADAASAQAAQQKAEADYAMVRLAVAEAEAAGNDLAPELARRLAVSETAQATSAARVAAATEEARYRMMALGEWRDFIREPLRRTREEMRSRGMWLPDLPPDTELGEDDA
jgi:transcriptional regulator with XRE-family HTH domain